MTNAVTASPSRWARFKNSDIVYYFLRDKVAMFSFAVFVVFVLAALLAPWIAPHNVYDQTSFDLMDAELPPSWLEGREARFWLGTDNQGRDIWSTILYGARISLTIGLFAVGLQLVLGIVIGLMAGYFGGRIDNLLMRFTDLMMAFPALLLAIALAAIFQPSVWIVSLVIAMVNWVQIARVIYAETSALSARDFIAVERTLGAGTLRILGVNLIPHLAPTVLVWATLGISTTVLLEATLSFLGVGVQPPTPSWGNIIFESQSYFTSAPWLVFFPGAAIVLLSLSFNIAGDALRDALDPGLKGRN